MENASIDQDYEVRRFLQKMRNGKLKEVSPILDARQGVRYAELQEELLERLYNEGLLRRKQIDNVLTCRSCGGISFMIKYRCPNCESMSLKRGMLIEHMTCGYIDLESTFANRGYICPKCKKKLRALGVDYRKIGIQYVCNDCKYMTPNPTQILQCWSCGEIQEVDSAKFVELYTYNLNPDAQATIEKLTIDFMPIINRMSKLGWVVRKDFKIKGRSGVEHIFTLAAWPYEDVSKTKPSIVVDLHIGIANENNVLSVYAKSIDTNIKNVIFAVVPSMNDKARALANAYGIVIIEANDIGSMLDILTNVMEDMISRLAFSKNLQ